MRKGNTVNTRTIKVMVVDDDPMVRRSVSIVLYSALRYQCTEAATGREALERAQQELFDAFIVDMSLPDCSGFDVLLEIRKRVPEVPVLILTGHRDPEYMTLANRYGAAAFLDKGRAAQELLSTLPRLLSHDTEQKA